MSTPADQVWRGRFPSLIHVERYLATIADLDVRAKTRLKLGLGMAPDPSEAVFMPAPQPTPRTRASQSPDVHTFLGTLEGGALLFALPWPPSLNSIWRATVVTGKEGKPQARVLLSREGRAYRRAVRESLNAYRTHAPFKTPPGARLTLTLTAHPPDRRTRDLSNIPKALEDALTHAGVWADDSLIDELTVRRAPVLPGGRVVVQITPLTETLFPANSGSTPCGLVELTGETA
ncbi:RusA family crossover junction endodeoxyribonuclease [Deinococcus oregonensis]|uniref:RusA family crossover junction endodeoxyribonuclease n=1 Tax=Deinococcus oregonensis TaxID=1805970 RepID=A0ABV6AUR6_9DEIO